MRYSLILTLVIGLLLNVKAFGQVNASSATAQASIIQPINLELVRDLSFGNISPGASPGSVVLDPTAASNRTATGGVTLPSGSGTVQSAKFIATGSDGCSFSITLPSGAITLTDGTHFMTIDNFTSTPSGSGVFASGSQTIYVGATLNVNANQEAGTYAKDFQITVNYN